MSAQINAHAPNPMPWLKYAILTALVWLVLSSNAQPSPPQPPSRGENGYFPLQGGSRGVLMPGQSYTAPDTTVILSFRAFTAYYAKRKQADSLVVWTVRYQRLTDSLIQRMQYTIADYQRLDSNQQQIIANTQALYEDEQQHSLQMEKALRREKIKTKLTASIGALALVAVLIL